MHFARAGAGIAFYNLGVLGRFAALLGSIALALVLGGCVKVAAYQRGVLAHPTMTAEEISYGLDAHVRAVSEGATGGLSGGGGGCGCN